MRLDEWMQESGHKYKYIVCHTQAKYMRFERKATISVINYQTIVSMELACRCGALGSCLLPAHLFRFPDPQMLANLSQFVWTHWIQTLVHFLVLLPPGLTDTLSSDPSLLTQSAPFQLKVTFGPLLKMGISRSFPFCIAHFCIIDNLLLQTRVYFARSFQPLTRTSNASVYLFE